MTSGLRGPTPGVDADGDRNKSPDSNDLGQIEGRWYAPHKFSAWLANRVQDLGKGLSVEVLFRPDGVLVFLYQLAGKRVPVFLAVGRRGSKGQLTRFGTLLVPVPCPPGTELRLLSHTAQKLEAAFPGEPPTWMRRPNTGLAELNWGAAFLEDYCLDLLAPGTTHWDSMLLRTVSFSADKGLTLRIGGSTEFEMHLVPGWWPTSEAWVGQYGPLVLTIIDPELARHPLVNYIGYALALLVPSDSKLAQEMQDSGSWTAYFGDGLSQDAFLIQGMRSGVETVKALLGAQGNVVILGNADRECAAYCGWHTGNVEGTHLDLWKLRASRTFFNRFRMTDFGVADLVLNSGEDALRPLLDESLAGNPDLIIVHGCCVQQMLGESSQRLLDAAMAQSSHRIPSLAVDVCLDNGDDYRRLWDTLLENTVPADRTVIPGALNLVGYGHEATPGIAELKQLLAEVGVQDVQLLLPAFDASQFARFHRAQATLVYPSKHVSESFSTAGRHVSNLLFPKAPWGVEGTLLWLDQVLVSLGKAPLTADKKLELCERHLPPNWDVLKSQAAQKRLGFACSPAYAKSEDAGVRHGLPLVDLVAELGFGLDLVLISPQGPPPHLSEDQLRRWRIPATGAAMNRVVPAKPGEQIAPLIRRTEPHVYYSEWEGDERLLAAGRFPFSYSDLRMGLWGAAWNMRILLGMARAPFLQRYASVVLEAGGMDA